MQAGRQRENEKEHGIEGHKKRTQMHKTREKERETHTHMNAREKHAHT